MHLKARKFHAVHTAGVVLISRARVLRKHLRKGLALFTGHLFPKARGILYRKVMPAGAGTSTLAGLQKADTAPKPKSAGYKPGDVVEHRVFGKGTVIKATPIAGDCIVEIQFDRVGVKRTMANYAPLTKLNEE